MSAAQTWTWLEYAVEKIRHDLTAHHKVDLPLLERFTGRLTNLSQFFPELRHALEVGYALSNFRWQFAPGTTYRRVNQLQLSARGRREEQLLGLRTAGCYVDRRAGRCWGLHRSVRPRSLNDGL